jgi:hypothetical protein
MRTLRYLGAICAAVALLGTTAASSSAEAVNPPPPRPRLDVPPPKPQQECYYVGGFHLQENGPPIPFFEWRCKTVGLGE